MLELCLGAQEDRLCQWWFITASPGIWVRSRLVTIMWLTSHKDMFVPFILALLCALKEKEAELCLPLPWVCCKTFSAQRNRPDSVFFLQTQVAAWGQRCRQPLASCPLPPRQGSMLLLGYGHLRKVLQNVFQVQLNWDNFVCVENLPQMRAMSRVNKA